MLRTVHLSFAAPWLLSAFVVLPLIWWLLRLIPPKALTARFPAVRLLKKLVTKEQSPAKSPPWLLFLRVAIVGSTILGVAQPLLNATRGLRGGGPLIMVVDDGWASAVDWPNRQRAMEQMINRAKRANRAVIIVATAIQAKRSKHSIRLLSAAEAMKVVRYMQPKPWPGNRQAALAALNDSGILGGYPPGQVMWFSNGLDDGTATTFVNGLKRIGMLTIVSDDKSRLPIVLMPPKNDRGALKITAIRATKGRQKVVWIRATGEDGRLLARRSMSFAKGDTKADIRLEIPAELRNLIATVRIEGENTAAGVALIDERWRRRPVGLVRLKGDTGAPPLLGRNFYVERALEPFSEIRQGSPQELIKRNLAVLVLADPGRLSADDNDKIAKWVEKGGILLRFAGPRLAGSAHTADQLLPVRLRPASRSMGGSMTWEKPAKLAKFNPNGPFHGLKIADDIRVRRQVLAQPSIDLADRTWASLSDGTPLVTAAKRGNGWTILVHTTANADWSNLALSGLFVKMLQRIVRLGEGFATRAKGPALEPLIALDGFGRLIKPPTTALAIAAKALSYQLVDASHPPGFYGKPSARRALNLSQDISTLNPLELGKNISGVDRKTYAGKHEISLKPWLLGLAMLLAVADMAASLALRGLLSGRIAVVGVLIALSTISPRAAGATTASDFALRAGLQTRLAYIVTGIAAVDKTSRAGLKGLSFIVRQRTAVELGPPMAVNPETDDLVFFPLLYWPLTDRTADISERAAANLNAYMRSGGTILFDTRTGGGKMPSAKLEKLAAQLDIPPLSPIPAGHVLGRSFYLLNSFPGRWSGTTLWLDRSAKRSNDGVSRIIVGANDWASAWAVDDNLNPLFAVIPGGERQREMAYRFGVNLVMYTLTGNYKSDQVHLKAIIKRLGK